MPRERFILTPLEGRVVYINEVFGLHYREDIARKLHPSYWVYIYNPQMALNPQHLLIDTKKSELFIATVDEALGTFTDMERQATVLRYSIDGKGIRTYKEIGTTLGVTRGTTAQIIVEALRKSRHPQLSRILNVYLP